MLALILIAIIIIMGVILLFITFYLTDLIKERYELYKARKDLLYRVVTERDNSFNFSGKDFNHVESGPTKSIRYRINKDCIITYEFSIKDNYKENIYYPCIVRIRYTNGLDIIQKGWIKVDKKLANDVKLKIKEE